MGPAPKDQAYVVSSVACLRPAHPALPAAVWLEEGRQILEPCPVE